MRIAAALLLCVVGWHLRAATAPTDSARSPTLPRLALGLLAPPDQPDSVSARNGALLGIARSSAAPEDRPRLVIRGQPGQWGTDGDEAAALALDDEVAAIITPNDGSAAHQVLQVAGRTRVPVVSLCPDSSITRAGVPWAVRIVPRTDQEAGAIFTGLPYPEQRGRSSFRWAAVVPSDRAGREAARDLQAAAEASGALLAEPIRIGNDNFERKARLGALLKSRPDGLLLWTDPATAAILARDARAAGFAGKFAGPARLRAESFFGVAGAAALGCIIPALVPDPDSEIEAAQFEAEYKRQFGSSPDFYALMAHDAVLLLTRLLNDSQSAGAELHFPILEAGRGASGVFRFDRWGNRLVSLMLMVCKEGGFESLSSVPPLAQTGRNPGPPL